MRSKAMLDRVGVKQFLEEAAMLGHICSAPRQAPGGVQAMLHAEQLQGTLVGNVLQSLGHTSASAEPLDPLALIWRHAR